MHRSNCTVLILASVLALSVSAQCERRSVQTSRPLKTVALLAQREAEKAPAGATVRLRTQVTFVDPDGGLLCVRDATGSALVQLPAKTKVPPLKAGDLIQLTGETSPGDVGAGIVHPKIRLISRRPLAAPRAVSLAAIEAGAAKFEYVVTEGVIRPGPTVGKHTWLTLVDKNTTAPIVISGGVNQTAQALIGAHATVRGVTAMRRDNAKGAVRYELLVQSLNDLRPKDLSKQDFASSAVSPVSQIRNSNPTQRFAPLYHVRGRVLRRRPGALVIADDSGSVEVHTAVDFPVAQGSLVDAIGIPELGYDGFALEQSRVRVLSSGTSALAITQSIATSQSARYFPDGNAVRRSDSRTSRFSGEADDVIPVDDQRKALDVSVPAASPGNALTFAAGAILDASDTLRRVDHPDRPAAIIQPQALAPTNIAVHKSSMDWRVLAVMVMVTSIAAALFWNRQIDHGLQAAMALLRGRLGREGRDNPYHRRVERNLEAVFSCQAPRDIRRNQAAVYMLEEQPRQQIIVRGNWPPPHRQAQIELADPVGIGAANRINVRRLRGDAEEAEADTQTSSVAILVTWWKASAQGIGPAPDRVRSSIAEPCGSIAVIR